MFTFFLVPSAMYVFYTRSQALKDSGAQDPFTAMLGLSFIMVAIAGEMGWHVTQARSKASMGDACPGVCLFVTYIYPLSFGQSGPHTELLFVSVGCGDGLWVGDLGGSRMPPLVLSAGPTPVSVLSSICPCRRPHKAKTLLPMRWGVGSGSAILREQPHGASWCFCLPAESLY
jgi:hypothetical protein